MEVQRKYSIIADESSDDNREKFIEDNGLSKNIYYAYCTKYRTVSEYIMHCEECYLSIRTHAEDGQEPEIDYFSYQNYLKIEIGFLRDSVEEIDLIKEKSDSKLRAEFYLRVCIQDHLIIKTGLKYEHIQQFKENNPNLVEKPEVKNLETQFKTQLKRIVDKDSSLREEWLTSAAEEEEHHEYFGFQTVMKITEIVYDSISDSILSTVATARKERRKAFFDVDKYLDQYENHEKILGNLINNTRLSLLKQWNFSPGTWEKSTEKYEREHEFCVKSEEKFLQMLEKNVQNSVK